MKLFEKVKGMFGKRVSPATQERSFAEIIRAGGGDWVTQNTSVDAEVFQNRIPMLMMSRDLWATNPVLAKYREKSVADVYGSEGIMCRSKCKETEDRVVHAPDEKWALIEHERNINRLRKWAEKKTHTKIEAYRIMHFADRLEERSSEAVIRGVAHIEVGAPDVYANQRIEAWWKEWQRAENCDVRGRRDYNVLRQLRLWSCARDGGYFIRLVKDAKPSTRPNAMGFAIQLINDEWCDYFYNVPDTGNGTTIRMGIEYPFTSWGIGKPIAYYFIKRMPRDWQYQRHGGWGGGASEFHGTRERILAEQIIHYARFLDNDSTRPAPWGIASFGKARQLDQYEVAEVIAARAGACKTGWLWSDLVPEGGMGVVIPEDACNPKKAGNINVTPGGLYALPYGVKYQADDPTHPNGNFQNFRQGMGQSISAALPGGDYNTLFNDLANINFSAGRLGRLDTNEINKMLQKFDIETAERPIFEAGLEMALITGAIPLPLSKFKKFNAPVFQGRRWEQVDEGKAVDAAAKRIANKLSSRSKECAERGIDFEDNAFELAEEDMLLESLGLRQETTAQEPIAPPAETDPDKEVDDDEEKVVVNDTDKKNGKTHPAIDKHTRKVLVTS